MREKVILKSQHLLRKAAEDIASKVEVRATCVISHYLATSQLSYVQRKIMQEQDYLLKATYLFNHVVVSRFILMQKITVFINGFRCN